MSSLFTTQAIIHENDLDENGCLNFDEFLISVAANIKVLSEEEHRSVLSRALSMISLRELEFSFCISVMFSFAYIIS